MHKDEVSNKNGMKSALNQDAKCWRFGASPGGSRGKPIMRVPSVGGAPTEEHTTLSHNKTRNTSFKKWKGRKCCCSQFGRSSLFNFPPPSNPKKDVNVVWRGLQCSFGWPPWPRWSASERFGSAPQHDTFALKCWGHEWNFRVGHHSISNLTSFVYVSFVSLMLWHCRNLSKQPPSKGLKWFWVSGTLVFLPQAYKEVLQQRKPILYKSATAGSPMLISTCDWRKEVVFPTKHLGHLGPPSSHPKRRHRLWRFHINEEGTTQSLSGHSECAGVTD